MIIGWAVALVALGSLLASLKPGGRAAAAGEPLDPAKLQRPEQLAGPITVWSWNVAAKGLMSTREGFNRRYPNIDVTVEMSGTNLQARFLLSLSSGTAGPDVMQLQGHEAARYTATGRLTDLTAVAAKYKDRFPPAAWANCVHDGRVYAIPWDIGPCAVFYKRDLLQRYGVDPESIETWDDFIAAGKQVREKSGGQTKMLPLSPTNIALVYEMLLQQLGGQVFDDEGRIAVASETSRRVMDLIRRMREAGICANVDEFSHEWMGGFNGDHIATYPGAVWLGGTMKDTAGVYSGNKARWGVFKLPAFERGGRRTSNKGGSVLSIPDQTPNKEAAWAFIEYALCTVEGQLTQYAKFDLFPAYLPALEDPFFQQPDPFYDNQKTRALFAAGVHGLPLLHRTQDWVEAQNYSGQAFTMWDTRHEPTGPMLETLSRKLQRRLGRKAAPEDATSATAAGDQSAGAMRNAHAGTSGSAATSGSDSTSAGDSTSTGDSTGASRNADAGASESDSAGASVAAAAPAGGESR